MLPEEFGSFLTEQRKKKEITQAQLAERIHVSTAAVSKWERGLCLPEVSKFEDIAKELDITLVELMQCRLNETQSEASDQLESVLTETIKLSEDQHRRKRKRLIIVTASILLFALLSGILIPVFAHYFPLQHVSYGWNSKTPYTAKEVAMLAYIGSTKDRRLAEVFVRQADAAMSDISLDKSELEEKYGLFARYTSPYDEYHAKSEQHSIELWSAHIDGDRGYIWVYYYLEVYNAEGEVVHGNGRGVHLWIIEKDETGAWILKSIKGL